MSRRPAAAARRPFFPGGAITQDLTVGITADNLTGQSFGAVSLNGTNAVGTIGEVGSGAISTITSFQSFSSAPMSFTNTKPLTVAGSVSTQGDLALTTTGVGSDLIINGDLAAGAQLSTLTLISSGTISDTSLGNTNAMILTGSAVGNALFTNGAYGIQTFGPFTAGGSIGF